MDCTIHTYDENGQPSCYKNIPNIKFPGILKVITATINITEHLNATAIPGKTRLLFTLKKNEFLVGYICKNGKSEHIIVESRDCNLDFCEKHEGLCRLMGLPGIHRFDEIMRYNNSAYPSGTIFLSSPKHGFTDAIVKGQWNGEAKITVEDRVVAYIKFPSDYTWNFINE